MREVYIIILCIWLGMLCIDLYIKIIRPFLIKKTTKELEKNPKWLMSELRSQYYGLDDIDVILTENKRFLILPRIRLTKDKKRLELLIPADMITTKDIDNVAKLLLISKISIKVSPQVGILYANKPTYWLSILDYMLDGGEVNQSAVSWKEKE